MYHRCGIKEMACYAECLQGRCESCAVTVAKHR